MSNQNITPDAPMTEQQVNELVKVRMDKLAALQEAGNDPFVITKYNVTDHNADISTSCNYDICLTSSQCNYQSFCINISNRRCI